MQKLVKLTKKSKKKALGTGSWVIGDPQGDAPWISNGQWAIRMDRTDVPSTRDGILGCFGLNGDTKEFTKDMVDSVLPDFPDDNALLSTTPWLLVKGNKLLRLVRGKDCFTLLDEDYIKLLDIQDENLYVPGFPSGEILGPVAFLDPMSNKPVALVMPVRSELSIDELPSVQ